MKTEKLLTIIATIWLVLVITGYMYSHSLVAGIYNPSLKTSIITIITFALPSWILYLIALKLHMRKKSIFSLSKI